MSNSAVEKVELENGVTLGERLEQHEAGYSLSKDEARTVFSGKVTGIECQCIICFETPSAHTDEFPVVYTESGIISIGCVVFTPEQVASVRKWLENGK